MRALPAPRHLLTAGLLLVACAGTGLPPATAPAPDAPAPDDEPAASATAHLPGTTPATRQTGANGATAGPTPREDAGERSTSVRPAAGTPASPTRLRIPALDIDAPVAGVGVDEQGDLAVIDDVETVGWYEHGPAPGGDGSAVLAAHVDTAEQGPGVFFDLTELAAGDEIVVDDGDGVTRRFVVRRLDRHDRDELPTDALFAREGPARLTLITCGGPFDPAQRSYRDNVVVTAVPA